MSPGDYAAIAAFLMAFAAVATWVAATSVKPSVLDAEFKDLAWHEGVPEEDGEYWMRNPHLGNEVWPCTVSHGVPDCHLAETDGVLWAEKE